jgi:RNA polymerase subunit RPABC4/transcription elongation factor Spt4
MARRKQACRNCRKFTSEKVCPHCQSTNLSTSWKGMVIIVDSESQIAKTLQINEPGKYALYVG